MNEHPVCGQPCSSPCSPTHLAQSPLVLSEVLASFEREAQQGVCDTGRYRMPYFVWGAGPPLVFIHGVSDTSRSFLLPMARLCGQFRCIGYELPSGHGDGARLRRYRHEDLVADLWALLDRLGIERAYVLGASLGATVALRAMRHRPERLPRAILQAGLAYRPLVRAELWLSWLARWLPGSVGRIPRREKILDAVHRHTFADQSEEVWRAYVEWTAQARLAALGHQARWLHRLDLRSDLPHIKQPVLLVWGDRDRTVPLAHAEMLRAALPSAGLVLLEGAGHVPNYTHPDALAEVVRRFLTPPTACPGPEACAALAEAPTSRG
jgi:pimeloyl-ACP methyl ester carboxylesterase